MKTCLPGFLYWEEKYNGGNLCNKNKTPSNAERTMNIHGTGCGILDCIYADEDFSSPAYQKAMSKKRRDGGLTPGQLVFSGTMEAFMGKPYDQILASLTGGKVPSVKNLGGPSAVALTHAAQILAGRSAGGASFAVRFYGVRGSDTVGDVIEDKITSLPFKEVRLIRKNCPSARVDALSDPRYSNNSGERTFVYRRGAPDEFYPGDLSDDFFDAGLIAFGGTALTPRLHDDLTELLKRSRKSGAVTEVNLVYDYRSEIESPGQKWKLGRNDDAYPYIDLLLADWEEAVKTSGKTSAKEAVAWFLDQGCGAVVITHGRQPVLLCAGPDSLLFTKTGLISLPVCEAINQELAEHPEWRGDTTGCGDNFAGQIIVEIAETITAGKQNGIDLREICIPATAAGGFACFIMGGVYYEKEPGEKRRLLEPYIAAYRKQLGNHSFTGLIASS
jgi:sugar/nucleoside kinase (ribokinase family)